MHFMVYLKVSTIQQIKIHFLQQVDLFCEKPERSIQHIPGLPLVTFGRFMYLFS